MPSRAHKEFQKYKQFINEQIWEKYGPSYCNPHTMGDTWRTELPYHKDVMDLVLLQTRVFIRLLDVSDLNEENKMGCLQALTGKMTNFLVVYAERNPNLCGLPALSIHDQAFRSIKSELWNEFGYTKRLENRVTLKRAAKEAARKASTAQQEKNRLAKSHQQKTK